MRTSYCSACGRPQRSTTLVIRGADDLKRLGGFRSPYDAIRFVLPGQNDNANRELEDEFQRYYFECGCKAGGYAMATFLVLACVPIIRTWYHAGAFPFDVLSWGFFLAIAGALVAKGAVILRARLLLARKTRQLAETLRREYHRPPDPRSTTSAEGIVTVSD